MVAEYPDGSSEIFPVTLNLIPEDTHVYDTVYQFKSIRTGSEDQLTPFASNQPDVSFPAGTSFTLTGYYEIDQLRSAGWKFELNPVTGELSVTVPISVIYPDGSRDNTIATMESVGPDDSELFKPDFDLIPIKSGDYIEIGVLAPGLPAGTEFHLDYYALPDRFFDLGVLQAFQATVSSLLKFHLPGMMISSSRSRLLFLTEATQLRICMLT